MTETFNGVTLEKREVKPEYFIGKNTVIMGASGGGKTVFAKYALSIINSVHDIPIAICFDLSGQSSFNGFFPSAYIHGSGIDPDMLSNLFNWQSSRFEIYKASCAYNNLVRVYEAQARNSETATALKRVDEALANANAASNMTVLQKTKLNEMAQETKIGLMRKAIAAKYSGCFDKSKFVHDKAMMAVIMGSLLNPNILLLFDDCGSELQKSKDIKEFFRVLYSRGRHLKITSIMLLQNDTQLEKRCRENVHQYFWTDGGTLASATSGSKSLFSKSIANQVAKLIASNFFDKGSGVYRLLGFDRDKVCLFFVESRAIPAERFGWASYWAIADQIEKITMNTMCNSNPLLND